MMEENYTGAVIIGVFAVIAFALCIIFRKKIHGLLDKFYEKITK